MSLKKHRVAISTILALVIGVLAVRSTIQRDDLDLQQHPLASLLGSVVPALIVGLVAFWLLGRAKGRGAVKEPCPTERVGILLSNPHAVAQGVLFDLTDEELCDLWNGMPANSDVRKSIEQEQAKRRDLHSRHAARRSRLLTGIGITVTAAGLGFAVYKSYHSDAPGHVESEPSIPSIPAPKGLVEASGASEVVRKGGLAGLPPSQRLLGVYYSADSLAEIIANGRTDPAPNGKAVMFHYPSHSAAIQGLRTLAANGRKDIGQRFDPSDPATERIIKPYEDAANRLEEGVAVKATGASPVGILLDNKAVFAFVMVTTFKLSNGTSDQDLPFAVAGAYVVVGENHVQLTMAYPFNGKESLTAASDALLDWVKAVQDQK